MLNIAVLDDNKIFLDKIYDQIIELLPDFQIRVDLFTESSHLLEERKKRGYQLYLLDIVMQNMTGIEVAKLIRETDYQSEIVFITSHKHFALEGYQVRALDYLVKPIDPASLQRVLQHTIRKTDTIVPMVSITEYNRRVLLPIDEVIAAEKVGRKTLIHTIFGDEYETNESMRSWMARLPNKSDFVPINRGTCVQLSHVWRIAASKDEKLGYYIETRNGKRFAASHEGIKFLQKKIIERS